ncbi:MAG: hypothetical protein H6732_11435 [Alphaproteobacteria bacterium]|nr:hypothetical protein [Alphaproteobacteria bacterium]
MSLLLLLTGCITLDRLVIPEALVDTYDLSSERIAPELFEEVRFPSVDGVALAGVWAHQPQPAPPLIWTHGNGGALDAEMHRIETYWSWGFDVFAWDYRGYGRSHPVIDADGILEQDGLAAVQYVSDVTGLPPEEIPWVSLSLGAAVMAHTNDEIGARAVVLENMFPSTEQLVDAAAGLDLPSGWFFDQVYDNLSAAEEMRSPVFVIHGLADDFIDPAYGPLVMQHLPADLPAWLWQPDGVAHSDIHQVIPDAYRERVLRFLDDPTADPSAPR